ncbi:phosphate acetyltransferase [Candidatus Erwinia haradaeae]|uniref:Phosphate acetyltransferase n=1 Tax=Candidatus Erwinia haradaeae TaxID=1922217 RepID=A0A803FT03_9GAMM|nr:phosphate acetyltransferase [Candidatus Erwinia haradaeae]VFP87390.1 Phosphate acetyltransferase [Candidatus Erwinia haradaeae]
MSRPIILIPTDTCIRLIGIILGILYKIKHTNIKLSVFAPFNTLENEKNSHHYHSSMHYQDYKNILIPQDIPINHITSLLKSGQIETLIEEIVISYYQHKKYQYTTKNHIILIAGLQETDKNPYSLAINYKIANALDAEIIFVTEVDYHSHQTLQERIAMIHSSFNNKKTIKITGVIINAMNTPPEHINHDNKDLTQSQQSSNSTLQNNIDMKKLCSNGPFPILGYIPWSIEILSPCAIDICHYLKAHIINQGAISTRQIKSIQLCSGTVLSTLSLLHLESLLVISANRLDLLITFCLASISNINISAILLTGHDIINESVKKICKNAFQAGLPVFQIKNHRWDASLDINMLTLETLSNNIRIMKNMQKYVADNLTSQWISNIKLTDYKNYRISPSEFCNQLENLARQSNKRIILPEGEEPRIIQAASISAQRGLATCILLGSPNKIKSIAEENNITINEKIEIVNPKNIRINYINRLVELRHKKGMDTNIAKKQLMNNIMLGTMMLECGEVDGLVAGALHTTADTIRPALQIIQNKIDSVLISSIFFMLLPDQVLIYGDCAINTNPDPEQLAEIAIQSANSALIFGIEPRVAMISYSTGLSGSGPDVEKVREATRIAKNKCPNLIIDGPLQYDAAIMTDIAQAKAPNSTVAGQATVLIFPDLNTGNTTYKAVQRTAHINSIGPMLQGMQKPVNDLSRGALIRDIIYTIALTSIQSSMTCKSLY